jgi:Tfp pilus assembly protein PilF
MGQPTAGLHLCLMLDKHYPNNSNIIGNIGAFYDMLKQWDKGLPYLRRAAAMHPEDPIDNWNLGWALSHMNLDEEADEWMQKSIQLDRPGDESKERKCLYGQFLVIKRNKRKQGCALVQSSCDKDDRKVCAKP